MMKRRMEMNIMLARRKARAWTSKEALEWVYETMMGRRGLDGFSGCTDAGMQGFIFF